VLVSVKMTGDAYLSQLGGALGHKRAKCPEEAVFGMRDQGRAALLRRANQWLIRSLVVLQEVPLCRTCHLSSSKYLNSMETLERTTESWLELSSISDPSAQCEAVQGASSWLH
jgi:hypothetical protein